MTVDKILNDVAANVTVQDRLEKIRKARDEKATGAANKEAARTADNADLSSRAKRLQETERILRFALERLEQFDEVRQEKLDEVNGKLQGDYYYSPDVDGEISERIFSDEELQERVRNTQQMRQFLEDVHQMDDQAAEEEIDQTRLDAIRQRVQDGFYDSEEVLGKVADRLLELTE